MLRPFPTATALVVLAILSSAPVFATDICGDVNKSSSVSPTDAPLVLKKAVGQSVTLTCPAIDDLAVCQQNTCGNGLAEFGEACDALDLHGKTCATETPDTLYGELACDNDCGAFDTSGCTTRFDASSATILDHASGLEWEKKAGVAGDLQYCGFGGDCSDLHGVNNGYRWGSGTAPDGDAFVEFIARLNGRDDGDSYQDHCDWRIPTYGNFRPSGTLEPPPADREAPVSMQSSLRMERAITGPRPHRPATPRERFRSTRETPPPERATNPTTSACAQSAPRPDRRRAGHRTSGCATAGPRQPRKEGGAHPRSTHP